jgi:hypothetical protein
MDEQSSLSHLRSDCKYHVVIPRVKGIKKISKQNNIGILIHFSFDDDFIVL